MIEKPAKNALDTAISDPHSGIYLSKNIKKVKRFLFLKGFEVKLPDIKSYLDSSKSFNQIEKNFSRRKISETSKAFDGQQSFFSTVHCDVFFLSKSRKYGSASHLVMLVCDQLSNFVYLERLQSTSSKHSIDCFSRIFSRSPYLPHLCKRAIFDNGIEFRSNAMKAFFLSHGIKPNYVRLDRLARGSRGSPLAERQIRRARKYLESIVIEEGTKQFLDTLKKVESSLNSAGQSCLGNMSSIDALKHDARYVSMLKHSSRFRRRKYLKKEMLKEGKENFLLYSIVRIKRSFDKLNFEKESYGSYSANLYIVINSKRVDFVTRYQLGSVFSLEPISDSYFAFDELKFVDISWPKACYLESTRHHGPVLKAEDNLVIFQPINCPVTYCTLKKTFDSL